MMRKYTAAPHPFIIEPPLETQRAYQNEEELSFGLVLIGRAVDYLPYFIYTFEELGRHGLGKGKGKYQLLRVIEEMPGNCASKAGPIKKVIYQGENKTLADSAYPIVWQDIVDDQSPKEICLNFLTPTRIKYENKLIKNIEFHIFFRNLLRRISLLSYFHCGEKLDNKGFKTLIEEAKQIKTVFRKLFWNDWERYSTRQGSRMKMGGFIGEARFQGDLKPFWPYIRLGEFVHIGKGSSFGLGKYEVT